jgi:putative SOS response-associated peptidase YedK
MLEPGEIVNDAIEAQRQAGGALQGWLLEPVDPWLLQPRYNIAPQQKVLTFTSTPNGRELKVMRWGFRPGWFTATAKQPPPINARAETLVDKPMFRGAMKSGRCLIPAHGFYEWQARPGTSRKQPMFIHLKGRPLFYFAGLYTVARDDETGRDVASCAIVTCEPNELMAEIHYRMPVMLDADAAARWTEATVTDPAALLPLLVPYPAAEMDAYPVAPLVSSVRNDGPELIARVAA